MTHVFISYSHTERALAAQLAERLTEAGYDVWWDGALLGGSHFDDAIRQVINEAPVAIVLWSNASAKSDWVKSEANLARERKTAVPVLVDDVPIETLPIPFQQIHAIELKGWDGSTGGRGFQQILKAVVERVGQRAGATLSHAEAAAKLAHSADEAALWADVVQSNEPQDYQHYLARVGPNSRFSAIAEVRLARALRRGRRRRTLLIGGVAAAAIVAVGLTALVLRPDIFPRPAPTPTPIVTDPSAPAADRCNGLALVKAPALDVTFCIDTSIWTLQTPPDANRDVYYAAPGVNFMISVQLSHMAPDDERQALIDLNQKMASTTGTVKLDSERTRALDNRTWTIWEIQRPRASDVEHTLAYYYSDSTMNIQIQFWNYADPSPMIVAAEPILKSLHIG